MTVTFLKSRHETQGRLDAFEVTIAARVCGIVPHLHREYDETILGVNGATTWTIASHLTRIGPGEQLTIPRGLPHRLLDLHEQTARILCIHTPGRLGPEYFEEVAGAMENEGPANHAELGSIMTPYGVIPATL